MKNNTTELVFILDRSGSMQGLEKDTIGGAIHHISNIHKYACPENVPVHTLFVITTDGMENAKHFGIEKDRAVNYHADKMGTHVLYKTVAKAVGNIRACAPLVADWSRDIEEDFESRK